MRSELFPLQSQANNASQMIGGSNFSLEPKEDIKAKSCLKLLSPVFPDRVIALLKASLCNQTQFDLSGNLPGSIKF